ncbi:MAG: malonic semialdehyde reductase [Syntrophaceae bacterium PtaU1.Bin231]|nr:MAG: malonic semialdehyde reductase [Syntrophaceae bacterium PtaU1.Bin231]
MDIDRYRQLSADVDAIFPRRWSPRAMTGEEISAETLKSLFEAARWAPSSNNNQPWRFLYARSNSEHWPTFFSLLRESNKVWAAKAAVLIVVISKTTFDSNEKPSRTHSYDAGAAWENLALQGSGMGLVVHGMQGFDYDLARKLLDVPDLYQVEAMIAVGKPGNAEDLPESLREREFPSGRKGLSEIAAEGPFRFR